ncbi:MAG TPA: vitamin B12 dependent-methionine synthase activation domain-containing protein, partial [Xanthobacteraceae bacterium]
KAVNPEALTAWKAEMLWQLYAATENYLNRSVDDQKSTLFSLLDAERAIGVRLTESFAMWPGAAVSGLYFSHPESRYFGVGKLERDQVEDYARRKDWTRAEAEKWLAPVLNYDPRNAAAIAAE